MTHNSLNSEFSLNPSAEVSDSGVGSWWPAATWWVDRQKSNEHILASVRNYERIADVTLASVRSLDVVLGTESEVVAPKVPWEAPCSCSRSLISAVQEVIWPSTTECLETKSCNLTLFVFEWKNQILHVDWRELNRMNVCGGYDWVDKTENGDVVVSVGRVVSSSDGNLVHVDGMFSHCGSVGWSQVHCDSVKADKSILERGLGDESSVLPLDICGCSHNVTVRNQSTATEKSEILGVHVIDKSIVRCYGCTLAINNEGCDVYLGLNTQHAQSH